MYCFPLAVKLTKYWDAVMDSHAWMAGIDPNRPAPMRFQHDQDILFGYMHSGYPIMTFLDVVDSTLDTNGAHWVSKDPHTLYCLHMLNITHVNRFHCIKSSFTLGNALQLE
jgi:hypothetical protein